MTAGRQAGRLGPGAVIEIFTFRSTGMRHRGGRMEGERGEREQERERGREREREKVVLKAQFSHPW